MSYTRSEARPQMRDVVMPRFHIEAVPDPAASAAEGRPIFREEERVQFMMPGGLNQPVERVNEGHITRWPEEYAAFKKGISHVGSGLPVEQWAVLTRAMVLELKGLELHTVEAVSAMPDHVMQRIRTGGHRLRELAKQHLDDAYAQSEAQKLLARDEEQKAQIAALSKQVSELSALVNGLHGQLSALQDRPPATATYVPGEHGVNASMPLIAPEAPAQSALDNLPVRKRKEAA